MKKLPIISLCLIALIATAAFARSVQDAKVAGDWDITIESPQGKRTSQLIIKDEGGKLSGMMKSQRGERPLDSISVKGNEITFTMMVNAQGQDLVITYKGKVDKDAMSGEADFGGFASGAWSAVPHKEGAAAPSSPAPSSPAPAAPAAAAAADTNITGVWDFEVETSSGTGTPVFTLKQDGEKVTGTYKGPYGEAPATGSVRNGAFTLKVKVSPQGQVLEITYTGKVNSKDSMSGKVAFGGLGEGTWTAKKRP